jgi:hypothetical protein
MEKKYTNVEFTPEKVQEQVGRFQEILYEFIKGLSKLRREQDSFTQGLSNATRNHI